MRLIIGGASQGKRAYVMEAYGIREDEILDGAFVEPVKIFPIEDTSVGGTGEIACAKMEKCDEGFKCITNFHILVKRLLADGKDPVEIAGKLVDNNPGLIVIMDEVGNGIIPLEKSDRIWREQVGRTSCILAARAESVERIVCGFCMRIK